MIKKRSMKIVRRMRAKLGFRREMGLPLFSTVILLVFLVISPIEKVEGEVECYVCHWQAPAEDTNNTSAVKEEDSCRPHNFNPERATTVGCESGCEAVSYKDTKDHKLLNFYRNCAESTSGANLQDSCTNSETQAHRYIYKCECTSNLCNTSNETLPLLSLLVGLLLSISSLSYIQTKF